MEIYENNQTRALSWASSRYAVIEEMAEGLANHWQTIHEETSMTEEEIILKMMPLCVAILSKHPEFSDAEEMWDY